jgi:hypothetical protein
MEPIKHQFRKDGFDFRIVKMHRPFVVFAKKRPHHTRETYEVVRLVEAPERTFPNGKTVPAHECLPWSESWGTHGFTYTEREDAEARFASMIHREFAQ